MKYCLLTILIFCMFLKVVQPIDNKLSSDAKSLQKDSSSDMVLNNNLKNMENALLSLSNPDLSELAENEKIDESDQKKDKDTHTHTSGSGSVKGVKEAKDFILARKAIDSAIDSIINNTNSKKKTKVISILSNKLNSKDKNDIIKTLLSRNSTNSVQVSIYYCYFLKKSFLNNRYCTFTLCTGFGKVGIKLE